MDREEISRKLRCVAVTESTLEMWQRQLTKLPRKKSKETIVKSEEEKQGPGGPALEQQNLWQRDQKVDRSVSSIEQMKRDPRTEVTRPEEATKCPEKPKRIIVTLETNLISKLSNGRKSFIQSTQTQNSELWYWKLKENEANTFGISVENHFPPTQSEPAGLLVKVEGILPTFSISECLLCALLKPSRYV